RHAILPDSSNLFLTPIKSLNIFPPSFKPPLRRLEISSSLLNLTPRHQILEHCHHILIDRSNIFICSLEYLYRDLFNTPRYSLESLQHFDVLFGSKSFMFRADVPTSSLTRLCCLRNTM